MGINIESITNAINVIQSNPIAFHSISAALQMIPVAGAVLGKYWDKYKDSKDEPTKDLLRALEAMKNMNQEQFENFSKKLEESNDRTTLNYLLLQKIDLQQGELAEQLTGTETRVIMEVQTIGTDVQANTALLKQLMEQVTLFTTQKGIRNTIDPDKKIEISDEELIKFKQQAEEIEKLKEELTRVNHKHLFDPDFMMKEANIYFYAGEHEKTIAFCDLILKQVPKHTDALFSKGYALFCIGSYDDAILCYDDILEIEPDNISVLCNKANALTFLGRYDEAIFWYNKVLDIDPNHSWALFEKGKILYFQEKYNEAMLCYDKVIEVSEYFDSWALLHKGNALHRLRRYDEAMLCYDKVIMCQDIVLKDLGYVETMDDEGMKRLLLSGSAVLGSLRDKGRALHRLRRYDEAIFWYNKAIDLHPYDAYTLYCKASTLSIQNKNEESITHLKNAIQLNPQYKEVAKKTDDFQNIANEESFKELLK